MLKKIFYLCVVVISLMSCSKEEYFDLSSSANVLEIEIEGQSGNALIFRDNDSIYIEVSNGLDLSELVLQKLSLSSFATSKSMVGDTIDFSQGFTSIKVTSENGTVVDWFVDVYEAGSEPQLQNSSFDLWYESSAGYWEIGESAANTIWGTANPGVEFGGMEANTIREPVEDGYAIMMITRYSALAAIVKKPIASGSAFTGIFNVDEIDINDPEAAIDFGTPFTASPTSFSLDYSYAHGAKNIDKNGKELGYPDSCDIYAVLERHDGDSISRVATAWLRTGTTAEEDIFLKLDFIYGELPVGTPSYMLPKSGEGYAAVGTVPTHINVVFASSAHGADFQGAEGSTLIVDNFELYYNE